MTPANTISRGSFRFCLAIAYLAAGCSGSSRATGNDSGGALSVGGGGTPTVTGGAAATGGVSSVSSAIPSGGTTQSNTKGIGGTSPVGTTQATGGKPATGGANPTGGKSATGGANATGGKSATGGANATGGAVATGGKSTNGGANATGGAATAGNTSINTQCSTALPSGASLVDTSTAIVIGTGTPDSCKFSDLSAAVANGGKIRFDCGAAAHTIAVTATMNLPTSKDTVIDGGNLITLDGGGTTQILNFNHQDFMVNTARVTLQRLKFVRGKATPTERIPDAPAPCSQGWNDGEGGALYMRDGNLTVIDCTFSDNHAAELGPDTGGGAIYILGSKSGALIVNSVFTNNSASNAGAVGGLFAELDIYNSLFDHNTATGHDANNNEPDKCAYINNDQNETGSGGNGGAIYQDGGSATNIILCGVQVTNNAAGTKAFGGGVFMTSNDWSGTITIRDTTITGNTGGSWTQLKEGSVTSLGTAFGINAKSATVSNSTLQK